MFKGSKKRVVRRARRSRAVFELLEQRVMLSAAAVSDLTPSEVRGAYGFNQIYFTVGGKTIAGTGAGQTIAIIDAYGDPTIANDLKTFDSTFSITNNDASGNFVLTVAKPEGAVTTNGSWGLETSLDVEWAHAIAPQADILLVEAKSTSLNDLMNAVNYARSQAGVSVVSMSWGSSEFTGETALDSYFTTPAGHNGVTFVAASGDSGTLSYPATSRNVLAVGGTVLSATSTGVYLGETAWSGSGGGISTIEGNYSPYVSYNAGTPYYVYDSTAYDGSSGWWGVGGTSAAAPQWAALVALANQGRAEIGEASLYGSAVTGTMLGLPESDFLDITSGNNGHFAAGTGFDLVTGKGSPISQDLISALIGVQITTNSSGAAYWPALTGPVPVSVLAVSNADFAVAPAAVSYAVTDAGTFSTLGLSDFFGDGNSLNTDLWASLAA